MELQKQTSILSDKFDHCARVNINLISSEEGQVREHELLSEEEVEDENEEVSCLTK